MVTQAEVDIWRTNTTVDRRINTCCTVVLQLMPQPRLYTRCVWYTTTATEVASEYSEAAIVDTASGCNYRYRAGTNEGGVWIDGKRSTYFVQADGSH